MEVKYKSDWVHCDTLTEAQWGDVESIKISGTKTEKGSVWFNWLATVRALTTSLVTTRQPPYSLLKMRCRL